MPVLSRRQLVAATMAASAVPIARRAQSQGTPVTVGSVLSLTGPGASLGIPERNTLDLLPRTIGGHPVRVVVLDDATDSSAAVRAARKLVDEEKADILFGPTVTPTSLAVLEVAGQAEIPMLSLAGSSSIVEPQEGARRWAFKPAPADRLMTAPIIEHMASQGAKTYAGIAFSTAFGDGQMAALDANGERAGLRNVVTARYNPTDTSLTPQVLRVLGAKPDAVFIGASGTPAVAPVLELRNRGFTGPVYTTQGVANPDVLRVGGKAIDGMILTVSPVLVAEQLPDSNPVKPVALEYLRAYEGKYGPGSRSLFGATAWDAYLMLDKVVPGARASAEPGTPPFRRALRDGIEGLRGLVGTQGVFNLSPTDHSGTDATAQVLVMVKDGAWKYLSG